MFYEPLLFRYGLICIFYWYFVNSQLISHITLRYSRDQDYCYLHPKAHCAFKCLVFRLTYSNIFGKIIVFYLELNQNISKAVQKNCQKALVACIFLFLCSRSDKVHYSIEILKKMNSHHCYLYILRSCTLTHPYYRKTLDREEPYYIIWGLI